MLFSFTPTFSVCPSQPKKVRSSCSAQPFWPLSWKVGPPPTLSTPSRGLAGLLGSTIVYRLAGPAVTGSGLYAASSNVRFASLSQFIALNWYRRSTLGPSLVLLGAKGSEERRV